MLCAWCPTDSTQSNTPPPGTLTRSCQEVAGGGSGRVLPVGVLPRRSPDTCGEAGCATGERVHDATARGPYVETSPISQDHHPTVVLFPNGNRALLLAPPAGMKAADILHMLGIAQPKALILVVGGTADLDAAVQPRLVQLCSRGIARAAATIGALIIDGGTQAGVIAMMGQGVADRGRTTALLGVAPAGKVTYPAGPADGSPADSVALDPNHSHFVLVESQEWGGEIETRSAVAAALATAIPVVTVLINDGPLARDEVLRSVRQGWPIIVVQGSGRLADAIATLWQDKPSFIPDPVLAEMSADGALHLFPLDGAVAALEDLITRQLRGDTTLKLAWERFALYDTNALRQHTSFRRLQGWLLALGVLGTLLVLTQTSLPPEAAAAGEGQWGRHLLHGIIVLVPIAMAILVAAANRFRSIYSSL
jgi:SLOG in TRPM, prokaryote